MAFNKSKALENAQKFVSQGKLKEAVAQFQKIHERDPTDQTALNTLGDLNVRLKNVAEALSFYVMLADVYVKGGFLVRGIAMFKKISKLDPKNTRALERLAELYTMQGLTSEARSHYLQLGEALLKGGESDKAMEVMQKLLDLEPDNLQVQRRLAELYERHEKKAEAAIIYRRIGDRLLFKGEAAQSIEWLDRAVALDPEDSEVLLLKARALQQTGKAKEALLILEKIPDPEKNPEAAEVLVGARLASGDTAGATDLAEKQFAADSSQFSALLQVAKHAAENNQAVSAIELLKKISAPALENDAFNFLLAVRLVAEAQPDSDEASSLLLEAGRRAGDQNAQLEALQRRGRAAEAKEDWEAAKQAYNELVKMDPGNPEFTQLLTQVRAKLGEDTSQPMAAQETLVADPEALSAGTAPAEAAPPAEELDEESKAFLESGLADIDLFTTYGMPDQALEKAEEVVARFPDHREASEKLLDLHVANKNEAGIAKIASRLGGIYRAAGDAAKAEEVAELAGRYAGAAAPEQPAAAETPAPEAAVKATPTITADAVAEAAAAGGSAELDLTAEWTSMVTEEAPAEAEPAPAAQEAEPAFNSQEAAQEVKFYLDQGLVDEAKGVVANYESRFPNEPVVPELRAKVDAAAAPAAAPEPPAAAPAGQGMELVLEEQSSGGDSASDDFFADLVGEVDATLAGRPDLDSHQPADTGDLVAAHTPPSAPAQPPPADDVPEGALADILSEFKEDLGEVVEEIADVETHYNLGIAYKEMGLYEEAISEFQKAAKAAEIQKDFRHVVQSCILLAICFRERRMPKVAVNWYDRALAIPGLDDEAALAIRFDKGAALEESGDRQQALDCFIEVYGNNVDYRNVGERIRDLQGS